MLSLTMRRIALALVGLVLLPTAAQAQGVKLLGDFRDWSSYSTTEGNGALCFALSKPESVEPRPTSYGQGYLYLTHRPAENVINELNVVAGFTFAPNTAATINVGGQVFDLFTEGDAAWLLNPGQGDALAAAIRAGSSLVFQGTTADGQAVTQTYSLSGATAASKAIDTGC